MDTVQIIKALNILKPDNTFFVYKNYKKQYFIIYKKVFPGYIKLTEWDYVEVALQSTKPRDDLIPTIHKRTGIVLTQKQKTVFPDLDCITNQINDGFGKGITLLGFREIEDIMKQAYMIMLVDMAGSGRGLQYEMERIAKKEKHHIHKLF
jgi:hypothetical protein